MPPAPPQQATRVLADRIAGMLGQHEHGWRLPRITALARRYNVSPHDINRALDELSARHLVRRLPGGQLYRSSLVEYLIPLEGITGLGTRVDSMGAELRCRRSRMSRRPVSAEISSALRIPPDEPACVLQLLWTSNGEPAATSTTYLAAHVAKQSGPASDLAVTAERVVWPLAPLTAAADGEDQLLVANCRPAAITVEMQPPPLAAAKRLRLAVGQPALLVTVRFDDTRLARPGAITGTVLHPDMFRLVLGSADPPY